MMETLWWGPLVGAPGEVPLVGPSIRGVLVGDLRKSWGKRELGSTVLPYLCSVSVGGPLAECVWWGPFVGVFLRLLGALVERF